MNLLKYNLGCFGIYLLKVINRNTRSRCKICSKLAIKNIFNSEHISHFVLGVSIDNFEQVNANWERVQMFKQRDSSNK